MSEPVRPILTGHKSLIVGIANEDSIAYGCAKAFREAGADLAVTWLNDKARPHVEPLADALGAQIKAAAQRRDPRRARGGVRRGRRTLGQARQPGPLDRLRAQGGPAGRAARLLGRRVRAGDRRLVPLVRAHGQAGRAADAEAARCSR
jgi:hypothetical protein